MEDVVIPTAPMHPNFWDYTQVAAALGVSTRTLVRYVRTGRVPSPQYWGTMARFPADYVAKVLAEGVKAKGTYPVADSERATQNKPVPIPPKKKARKPSAKKPAGPAKKGGLQKLKGRKRP